MPNGCGASTRLTFGIASNILYNPEFEADVIDSFRDSLKLSMMINSTKDRLSTPYIIEQR